MTDAPDTPDTPSTGLHAAAPPGTDHLPLHGPFRLNGWLVEPSSGRISREGRPGADDGERLEPKVMAVLVELARRRDRVVSKEELIEAVWPQTHVGEAALSRCISELRRALGDDARNPRYIETLPKRGYRLLAEVSAAQRAAGDRPGGEAPPYTDGRMALDRWRINRLVAALLVAVLLVTWWLAGPDSSSSADDAEVESLAVLPLRALSEDPEARLLAEGLTRQLVTELASIEGLTVAASSAARGLDPEISARHATESLGVDAVLTGSVRASAQRTLVSLELVHGSSALDLWAGSYQEIGDDPLEVQQEVAAQATREIAAALAARANKPLLRDPASPAVRLAMERGNVLGSRLRPADALRAVDAFREALRLDEEYALAWAMLADQYAVLGWNRWEPAATAYGQARAAAYEALDLEPRLPEAHAVLGAVAAEAKWDWPEARRFFETAVRLGPGSVFVRERFSRYLRRIGLVDEALEQSAAALELRPGSLIAQVSHGWNLLLADRLQEAEAIFLHALEMDDDLALASAGLCAARALGPDPSTALTPCARAAALPGHESLRGAQGYAQARAGNTAPARAALEVIRREYAGSVLAALPEATVLVGLDEREAALDALERAVDGRDIRAAAILADPYLRQLADEPRFQRLLERMLVPGGDDG